MGFLYGRYEDHTDVPLGIRLVMSLPENDYAINLM